MMLCANNGSESAFLSDDDNIRQAPGWLGCDQVERLVLRPRQQRQPAPFRRGRSTLVSCRYLSTLCLATTSPPSRQARAPYIRFDLNDDSISHELVAR